MLKFLGGVTPPPPSFAPLAEFLARDQSELDEIGTGGQFDVADAGDSSNITDGPIPQEPIVNGFADQQFCFLSTPLPQRFCFL